MKTTEKHIKCRAFSKSINRCIIKIVRIAFNNESRPSEVLPKLAYMALKGLKHDGYKNMMFPHAKTGFLTCTFMH